MTTDEGRQLSKIQGSLMAGGLIPDDGPGVDRSRCRARVQIYIGQRRAGGSWVQCGKAPRPGKKTCHWHRAIEGDV